MLAMPLRPAWKLHVEVRIRDNIWLGLVGYGLHVVATCSLLSKLLEVLEKVLLQPLLQGSVLVIVNNQHCSVCQVEQECRHSARKTTLCVELTGEFHDGLQVLKAKPALKSPV